MPFPNSREIREENPQLVCLGILVTNYYPEKIATHKKMKTDKSYDYAYNVKRNKIVYLI